MALNLFTVPPHLPFLESVARGWLARGDDPLTVSHGLILLPTRRSARALADAFLRVRDGKPLLLPRITAIGALDETPLTLAGALDLPPAVEPMQRLAALSTLILAMHGAGGAPRTADRAWLLARELAALMDEAERAGIDLARQLPDAADPEYAAHWAQTLHFLHIVTEAWPAWLAENGVMNPAARQVALLRAASPGLGRHAARRTGSGGRHHRRHSRRRPPAARGRSDAERSGRAAATGPRACRPRPGPGWNPPTPRLAWRAC